MSKQNYNQMGTSSKIPIKVKLLIEGEEEIGSVNLSSFVQNNKDLLMADLALGVDGNIHPSGRPEIALGMKGLLYVELAARGPRVDLHCGKDPIVSNPAWRLVWALATIKDENNRILIDGFYDRIKQLERRDLEMIDKVPVDTFDLMDTYGVDTFIGDGDVLGTEALKKLIFEPTCSIDGIWGGVYRLRYENDHPQNGQSQTVPEACTESKLRRNPR